MGMATGCGFKEIYRFPHTTYPYSSSNCTFLQQHPYFFFFFLMFFVLVRYCNVVAYSAHKLTQISIFENSDQLKCMRAICTKLSNSRECSRTDPEHMDRHIV